MGGIAVAETAVRTVTAGAPRSAAYDEAFSKAYEAYYTKIFAFIYSRVRDVELARDLVSGVFEKAYSKGHEVREQGAYGAWLFMIAKNLIAGHYRRSKREFTHLDRARDEMRFVDGPPEPEEVTLGNERVTQLMKHVRKLTTRDQELLSLKFDAELTNAEIGQIMNLSPLNVRVSIFRALKRLRSRLETDEVFRQS